jgi:hypothetical protein
LDPNLYIKSMDGDVVILVIYVDDIIITGSKAGAIAKVKSNLCLSFDMINLGLLHYCIGVEVWQTYKHFCFTMKYAKSLLDRFRMADCKISSTPMEKGLKLSAKTNSKVVNESVYRKLVGSLIDLIHLTATRPDLHYVVSYIS